MLASPAQIEVAETRHAEVVQHASMEAVAREVAERHGLPPTIFQSRCRLPEIAAARQELMWALYQPRKADGSRLRSTTRIGHYLKRDHTTVLHGIRAHAERHGLPV